MRTLSAIIRKEKDMYIAECPEVGTVSQGNTIEEAVSNLKEATELYIEEFAFKDDVHAIFTTFNVAGKEAS